MDTICYPSDAAVIGQLGHHSCDNWTDVRWMDYANVPVSLPSLEIQELYPLFFISFP